MAVSGLVDDVANRAEIVAECRMVITANTPATAPQLAKIVFSILNHYDSFDRRSEQSKAALMSDWLESLSVYPVDILERAARSWRECDKSAFMPTIGQIVALMKSEGIMDPGYRAKLAERADDVLRGIHARQS